FRRVLFRSRGHGAALGRPARAAVSVSAAPPTRRGVDRQGEGPASRPGVAAAGGPPSHPRARPPRAERALVRRSPPRLGWEIPYLRVPEAPSAAPLADAVRPVRYRGHAAAAGAVARARG